MLLIGELINTSRKAILAAMEAQDSTYIADIVKKQDEADADYIDVNCGSIIGKEVESMEWLINVVQSVTRKPLCIDSPNPNAIKAGLALVKNGQPMINSISAESERFAAVLPSVLSPPS
ncbi:dihydropteroate synthase [Desulfosporosinus sp. BICA1-9]|uniref:dihydropteroate synthase n=1 Tax=Desulfosporosinus sp. BICA1-9 TaxID=1531958 RepID=UPI000A4F2ED1|nr:dihydropteroate synthase [Desulfosporosinus sp. BICA1-9]